MSETSLGSFPASAGHEADPSQGHDRFALPEAVSVLSHYDLGVIAAVQEFRRGSRRSPKLLIKCERGLLILKRLAPGRDGAERVAFTHRVQEVLSAAGYPLPRLLALRGSNDTALSLNGRMYELFECVSASPFDHSPAASFESGRMLARFHRILAGERITGAAPTGSYHRLAAVPSSLGLIPLRVAEADVSSVTAYLHDAYLHAAGRADTAGLPRWPPQYIHGDWHPGNLLYHEGSVAAVIDYDTTRLAARALDIANGALQFSLTRTGGEPDHWPEAPDETRLKCFCAGYDSENAPPISREELAALPWLMIEAIIAESAIPIAATGRFGRLDAAPFLRMVERKARWMGTNAERITNLLS